MFLLWMPSGAGSCGFGEFLFNDRPFWKDASSLLLPPTSTSNANHHIKYIKIRLNRIGLCIICIRCMFTTYVTHLENIYPVCSQTLCWQPLDPVFWSLEHVCPSWLASRWPLSRQYFLFSSLSNILSHCLMSK